MNPASTWTMTEPRKKWTREAIRALRKRLGMTQKAFAEELGYSRYISVTELERGDYSPSGPAKRLLDMLEKQAESQEEAS